MVWIIENKEWIFSGVGVAIILFIINKLITKNSSINQKQSSGFNSINYQVNGDLNVHNSHDDSLNITQHTNTLSSNNNDNISKQAISILQQFEEKQASNLVESKTISKDKIYLFLDGKGGNLSIEEQRYINDDLNILVESNYLTYEVNDQGYNMYKITRKGSKFVSNIDTES